MSRDDLRLGELLDALPVTEHQPDFWDRLEAELETETVVDLTDRSRRRWTLTAAAAAAIIAVVAIAYTLLEDPDTTDVTTDNPPTTVIEVPVTTAPTEQDGEALPPPPEQPALVDATDQVSLVAGDGYQVNHLVTTDDAIWALGIPQDGPTEVRRLDPATGQTVATIDLPAGVTPFEILPATDTAWIFGADAGGFSLHRIDPDTDTASAGITYWDGEAPPWLYRSAARGDELWMTSQTDPAAPDPVYAFRVDTRTDTVVATTEIDRQVGGDAPVAIGAGAVWIGTHDTEITRIDPTTNEVVAAIPLPPTFGTIPDVLATDNAVWAVGATSVAHIDPATNTLDSIVNVLDEGDETFAGDDEPNTLGRAVLVEDQLLVGDKELRIHRIDTQTATVTAIVQPGATPSWPEHLHTTNDHLWFLQPGGIAPDPLARVPLETVLHPGES
jgi:hypothetical protein